MKLKHSSKMKLGPLVLAMMIIATGQMGVSIYLPSLPLISESLQVDKSQLQSIVTLFLVGFGVSQLFYGPLSDAIGRRPVFLLGQFIYLIGTVICLAFSDSITTLEAGRLFQGLGAGSASVLGRSVLRDSYDGGQLTKALTYLSVTASIMPILSPVLGGWVAFHLSWHAVFAFVLVYLGATFVIGWFVMPETLPYAKQKFRPSSVLSKYLQLIKNPQVIVSASYNWFSYLAAVVSLSIMPYLMQQEMGMSAADYGTLMIIPSAGLLGGSLLLNMLNKRYSTFQLLALSIGLFFFAGLWLLITPFTVFNLIWAFTWLTVAQGLSFPLSITLLLQPHKKDAGSVSALSGSVQMCIAGFFGSYLVGNWVTNQMELGALYLCIGASMGAVLLCSVLKKNLQDKALLQEK
ncbi:multidrug effflux MFS transporter [Vibrio breoganii]|uniref:multidrug effflux MFS transporter n=1 Tax=Vibrio breoganii TaxID=553239 RepID=UPI000CBED2E5|nr:MFS transporter [Vibrio breoganii]PMO70871.1 MFS transporter [Vibrio breoganii]PMO87441.1 MFS transporter [Vibrio breoganii]